MTSNPLVTVAKISSVLELDLAQDIMYQENKPTGEALKLTFNISIQMVLIRYIRILSIFIVSACVTSQLLTIYMRFYQFSRFYGFFGF